MPPTFVFLSNLCGVAWLSGWNCAEGKEGSIFVWETVNTLIFLLITCWKASNLLRNKFFYVRSAYWRFHDLYFPKLFANKGEFSIHTWPRSTYFLKNWILCYKFTVSVYCKSIKCFSVLIVKVWSMKVISCSPHTSISGLLQMVGVTWSYMQLTLAQLNDLTLICFVRFPT